jgi:hypothetical protein
MLNAAIIMKAGRYFIALALADGIEPSRLQMQIIVKRSRRAARAIIAERPSYTVAKSLPGAEVRNRRIRLPRQAAMQRASFRRSVWQRTDAQPVRA